MTQIVIRPIRSEDDYAAALARIDSLMDAASGTWQMDELEVLAQLVEGYEDTNWPMGTATPIAAIIFRMEQSGLKPAELQDCIGRLVNIDDLLNEKLPLTLEIIRALHKRLGIP